MIFCCAKLPDLNSILESYNYDVNIINQFWLFYISHMHYLKLNNLLLLTTIFVS